MPRKWWQQNDGVSEVFSRTACVPGVPSDGDQSLPGEVMDCVSDKGTDTFPPEIWEYTARHELSESGWTNLWRAVGLRVVKGLVEVVLYEGRGAAVEDAAISEVRSALYGTPEANRIVSLSNEDTREGVKEYARWVLENGEDPCGAVMGVYSGWSGEDKAEKYRAWAEAILSSSNQ